MYHSGISASDFIASIKGEADIAIEIPEPSWYRWLSGVEQFVYTEILKEYVRATVDLTSNTTDLVDPSVLPVPEDAAIPIYDDIITIYGEEGQELQKSGAIAGYEFPEKDLYYADYRGFVVLSTRLEQSEVTVIYRIRPIVKTEANAADFNVALPVEYLDMAGAKIRGEAYKIANEDGLAAKWLADYNQQIENFKIWASSRNERYGA